ncbi:MAG: beta-propeller fold lactonase family protein [Gemmatimonadota bacterium]|nr:beta-propeller fold lactonase family protein [Gemmatimonadota bacterium]
MTSALRGTLLAALAGLSVACSSTEQSSTPLSVDASAAAQGTPGAVAIASNATTGNAVLVFARRASGSLEGPASYATGGTGTGAGLGNQGAVTLSGDRQHLFVVNAGSNDVSVFSVAGTRLTLVHRMASGGMQPISVTEYRGLVYVLNAGGSGNISGFRLSSGGMLSPIAGATQPLSGPAVGPAQVGFSPNGATLVVTEKATRTITLYDVDGAGLAGAQRPQASVGMTPFGFAFDTRGVLVVSEAFGGAVGASATSSYAANLRGGLVVRSGSVGNGQAAACWVAITPNNRYAYVTNTASGNVSGYGLDQDGRLTLLASGISGTTGAGPIDMSITPDGRRLFTLDGAAHQLSNFAVRTDGSLEASAATTGLPVGANGMAAW